jgi:hypothetical protein
MGKTSDPETLVIHQKVTLGYNPEDFKQHYDHGGSLQLHIHILFITNIITEETKHWLEEKTCCEMCEFADPLK